MKSKVDRNEIVSAIRRYSESKGDVFDVAADTIEAQEAFIEDQGRQVMLLLKELEKKNGRANKKRRVKNC
jgi:hypothetical protein